MPSASKRGLAQHEHAIGGKWALNFYRGEAGRVAETPDPVARVRVNMD